MRRIIIENIDLMSKDEEKELEYTLKKLNVEYKKENIKDKMDKPNITEVCECGGLAAFSYWDEGNNRIPILKCSKCGDEFEAHEDYWRK